MTITLQDIKTVLVTACEILPVVTWKMGMAKE